MTLPGPLARLMAQGSRGRDEPRLPEPRSDRALEAPEMEAAQVQEELSDGGRLMAPGSPQERLHMAAALTSPPDTPTPRASDCRGQGPLPSRRGTARGSRGSAPHLEGWVRSDPLPVWRRCGD